MANARHSKAGRFVQQRLFAGLSAFVQLEGRIADLPDGKSCGAAFEVFAEAYLATQRKHDAETFWPLSSVPTEFLGNLQLAMQDYGVDGVLQTRLGQFSAYQVKFRTGRPALTWRELSRREKQRAMCLSHFMSNWLPEKPSKQLSIEQISMRSGTFSNRSRNKIMSSRN